MMMMMSKKRWETFEIRLNFTKQRKKITKKINLNRYTWSTQPTTTTSGMIRSNDNLF